jgi:hypothetical protein
MAAPADAASLRPRLQETPMHPASRSLTTPDSHDGRRECSSGSMAGEPRRERLPVSVHCPACGRSRLIYTRQRAQLNLMLICPACRGTSSEPRW